MVKHKSNPLHNVTDTFLQAYGNTSKKHLSSEFKRGGLHYNIHGPSALLPWWVPSFIKRKLNLTLDDFVWV